MTSVLLIGTGRTAFHLGHAVTRADVTMAGVVGREASKTAALATALGCPAFSFKDALPAGDVRLLCISDDAIEEVAKLLPMSSGVIAHTSGAKSVTLLGDHAHRGVLWPIQSLSPGEPIDLLHVPLVIDAEDEMALNMLRDLAKRISSNVVELTREKRQLLHLSAVFASNFPVFLLREAERLLKENGLSPELIHPLWQATTAKASLGAEQALTGPARRGDLRTIGQHLDRLTLDPDLRRAYGLLSDLILKSYHPDKLGKREP